MRRKLVAGNWKMHGTRAEAAELLAGIARSVDRLLVAETLVCPPFVHLVDVAAALRASPVALGAQDVCGEAQHGAYTGEVSGQMLADAGCRYVIVGHSERRALYGETDARVAAKFKAAQEAGLVPILCVGETAAAHDAGETRAVVRRQIDAVVDATGVAAFASAVVAYEPVWAIGTGKTATPMHAQEVQSYLRGLFATRDAKIADSLRILYGGSVKASNAAELFSMPDVDGGLIGGASLSAPEFIAICRAAGRVH
jgi:triosephosphate isomerase (TIM)